MSAPFDNEVQQIHSFRPSTVDERKPWVKIVLNPQPPKIDAEARALWSKYSLDFYAPGRLPAVIEGALIDTILLMFSVLSALRYKKAMADLDKEELTDLIESVEHLDAPNIYSAHTDLLATLRAEYDYLLENETGVVEV